MKKKRTINILFPSFIALFLLSFSLPSTAQEQDVIYLVGETPVKGNIVEVTGKKVKYTKESGQLHSFDAKQIIMLFNEAGSFLIFPPLKLTTQVASDFISSASKPAYDLLITLDKQVIHGSIISANENEVMYQDAQQQNGERSIGKDILALIIFKNGQHELLVSPSQASEILYATSDNIEKLNTQVISSNTEEKVSVPKPVNEVNIAKPEDAPAGASTQPKVENLPKPEAQPKEASELILPEEKLTKLKGEAIKKVQKFSDYVAILSNNQTDRQKAKITIDLACALFVGEDARVEVANIRTGVKNKYKIKDYLNRLYMHTGQYAKIDIDYANVNYASNVKKTPEGNYHRQIEYWQTYKGFNNGNIVYGDLTKRKAVVTKKNITKNTAAMSKQEWDVFLSDIGVMETQKPE